MATVAIPLTRSLELPGVKYTKILSGVGTSKKTVRKDDEGSKDIIDQGNNKYDEATDIAKREELRKKAEALLEEGRATAGKNIPIEVFRYYILIIEAVKKNQWQNSG